MTLKEKIVGDMKLAMKEKNELKRDTLRVIISELERLEQSETGRIILSDSDIIKVIKKSCNNIIELLKVRPDDLNSLNELKILEFYLPKQMNADEINESVKLIISDLGTTSIKDMGKIIGKFNLLYPGMVDGKLLSEQIKNILI
jgi:hypothetical protein